MRLSRRAAVLAALPLILAPLPALAAASSTPAAETVSLAAAPTTSWAPVPVAERLQPLLADQLASGGSEPLRVMVSGTSTEAALDAVAAAGLRVQDTWDVVGVVVAVGPPDAVRAVVTQPGVTYVEADEQLAYTLDTAHAATRSDAALQTYATAEGARIDGAGVTIAVIDSGIDSTHPMFQRDGATTVVRNLRNVCDRFTLESETCFRDDPVGDTDVTGAGGHGTHVAGIAGGVEVTTTGASPKNLRGAAPGANLVGFGLGQVLFVVNANAAMNWVVEHQAQPCKPKDQQDGPADPACPPIRVTNHSYGPGRVPEGGHTFDENSATVRLQRALVDKGVVPVWAAGNSAGDGTIATTNPPAMDPTGGVLMVGSYNDGGSGNRDGSMSSFSSRGKKGDPTTYPDISAPGDRITSACRPYLPICSTGFAPLNGPGATDIATFNTISGTSMASPYVAGVVAQLFQANPDLAPAQVEDLLEDTAHEFAFGADYEADPRNPDGETSFDKGHGLVDVLAVLAAEQGLPAPSEPAPSCTSSSFQVLDPAGDASQVVVLDTPLPSQDSLDIQKAYLLYNDTAQTLTFRIAVTDLAAGPPAGSVGEFFRFYISSGSDPEVFVTANRRATGETFSLRQQGGVSTPLEGVFDETTDEVSVTLPLATYGTVLEGRTIAPGDTISVGQVLGQRDGNGLTLTADTAAGSCPFVVGTSTPGQEPADGGGSTPPADECETKGNEGKGNGGSKCKNKDGKPNNG